MSNANTQNQNAAQLYNLQNQQNISNQNTDLANKQTMYNSGLIQQNYQNQLQKAQGVSGANQGLASAYNTSADRTAGQFAGIGSAVGQGVTGIANYNMLNDYLNKKPGTTSASDNAPLGGTANNTYSDDEYKDAFSNNYNS